MTKKGKSKPILVPVDFSTNSESALLCAAELADALGSELVVLHVVHDPGDAPGYYAVKGRNKQMRRMEDVAAEMLEEFLQTLRKKHTGHAAIQHATTMLVVGLPVNRILGRKNPGTHDHHGQPGTDRTRSRHAWLQVGTGRSTFVCACIDCQVQETGKILIQRPGWPSVNLSHIQIRPRHSPAVNYKQHGNINAKQLPTCNHG